MVRNENMGADHTIKEHIISSQMRRINRELPISEVYHERSLGLGLAPPLSKLIMSNNIAVAQVDHHQSANTEQSGQENSVIGSIAENINNFDNLSVIEDAHPTSRKIQKKVQRPPVPPKPEPWVCSPGLIPTNINPRSLGPAGARDEGDGRSMTDSQYSGCSPSTAQVGIKDGLAGQLSPRFNYMKINEETTGATGTVSPGQSSSSKGEEGSAHSGPVQSVSGVTTVINTNIHPSDIAHYINSEFHSKKEGKNWEAKGTNTKHPHMWTKDQNGRFTYTGSFSSDC